MNNFSTLPKDLLSKLSLELGLLDIFELSNINKRFNNLIIDDIFWMNKFYFDYGHYPKTLKSWNEFYKFVTITEPNDLLWIGVNKNILSYVVVALKLGADIENISWGFTVLAKASLKGHLEIVKYLVKHGTYVRAYNDEAFRYASKYGHLEVVKYLVEQGADVSADSEYALRFASEHGHLEVVKYLVKQGADIHAKNDLSLKWASSNGHLEVVKYLVGKGANVRASRNKALIDASEKGHLDVVKYLVGKGADVSAGNDSALYSSRYNGHSKVVKYLKSVYHKRKLEIPDF